MTKKASMGIVKHFVPPTTLVGGLFRRLPEYRVGSVCHSTGYNQSASVYVGCCCIFSPFSWAAKRIRRAGSGREEISSESDVQFMGPLSV